MSDVQPLMDFLLGESRQSHGELNSVHTMGFVVFRGHPGMRNAVQSQLSSTVERKPASEGAKDYVTGRPL